MIDMVYFDSFAHEFCLPDITTLNIAPPERFLPTIRGTDSYLETYEDGCHKTLTVEYSQEDAVDSKLVNTIRFAEADKYDFNLMKARMTSWTIPSSKFDEYVSKYIVNQYM